MKRLRALAAPALLLLLACGGGSDDPAPGGGPGVPPLQPGGTWGIPEVTFTIPSPANHQLYLPDIQASYPSVDWAKLDRLYIPAGHYKFIQIGNLPKRSANRPLVISNSGGQVRIGGLDHYYLFVLKGGANWVLTGQYDSVSRTGDPGFLGHFGNHYTATRDTYGILVDDEFYPGRSNHGIAIGGGATDFEVSFIEIRRTGFDGMNVKTDDNGAALMSNVRLHDLYIHDTKSEGFYIGSTQTQPQHAFEGLKIYNNRVLRTGTEALQVGQLGTGTEIHHNVFGPAALDWKDAFQTYQDSCSQFSVRYGRGECHHNVFIGAAGTLISFFGMAVDGDPRAAGDHFLIRDNYYSAYRSLGAYVGAAGGVEDGITAYRFENNVFRGFSWQRHEVYPNDSEPAHVFRTFISTNPIVLKNNRYGAPANLINTFTGANGASANVSATGNALETVAPLAFHNAGLPADFDYLLLELWTATASRAGGAAVSYHPGDHVMFNGRMYRSIAPADQTGLQPDLHPEAWEDLGLPPDDVRLAPGSPHGGVGLLDLVP